MDLPSALCSLGLFHLGRARESPQQRWVSGGVRSVRVSKLLFSCPREDVAPLLAPSLWLEAFQESPDSMKIVVG
ncbi:MAG: hypothetical protein F6K11_17540 [Leptolyngbya sp. SIO3F4]|nr:hypothetical protein [Leptolyngbya sp. SIO3F4]